MRTSLIALATLSFSCIAVPAAAGEDDLEIYVIDVGQGDSTLIVGPEQEDRHRSSLLIDAGDLGNFGKPDGAKLVQGILNQAKVGELDHVLLSHYDADHMGGFVTSKPTKSAPMGSSSLLWTRDWGQEGRPCEPTAFFPKVSIIDIGDPVKKSNARDEWLHCVPKITKVRPKVEHVGIDECAKINHSIDLGKGVLARIVAGRGCVVGNPDKHKSANTPNEMSIAVLVSTKGGFDFLVTGDLIGREHEDALANALSQTTDLEILRTGHHGAANATSESFVTMMKPEVAFISVGFNSYDHPHCDTFNALQNVLALQTSGEHPKDCNAVKDKKHLIANGTIRIDVDVEGEDYEIHALPETSSSDDETIKFTAKCMIGDGCKLGE